MRKLVTLIWLLSIASLVKFQSYFPPRNDWEAKNPTALDINQQALNQEVQFTQENKYSGYWDLRVAILEVFKREPYNQILGSTTTKKRVGPSGIIIKDGYMVVVTP